ncbi:hypothetical protein G6F22_017658 [Rhizopus arrhizus]|nr:hypothetical protein G6F22_017658 [Rhizopus arrhizus]
MAYLPAGRASGSQTAPGAQVRLTRLTCAVHAALAFAVVSSAMLPLAAAHAQSIAQASAQAAARGYRIPAGALAEALPRFADSAGVTVLFDAKLVGQRRTDGLEGTYSVNEGFARLLAGSGLAVQERTAGVFVLLPAPQPGVTLLTPVQVEGEGAVVTPAWETSTDRKQMDDLQIKNWSDLASTSAAWTRTACSRAWTASSCRGWTMALAA